MNMRMLITQFCARSRNICYRARSKSAVAGRAADCRNTWRPAPRRSPRIRQNHNGFRSFDYAAVGVGKSLKAIARRQSRALDQHRQLRTGGRDRALFDPRPDESTFLQPLGKQTQPAGLPQQLRPVGSLDRNKNRCPRNGSPCSTCCTSAAGPSWPLRISTGASARYTFVPGARAILKRGWPRLQSLLCRQRHGVAAEEGAGDA